jgi:hypothetical protein
MGTRGHLTFVIGGQKKTSYNHWDSYPSALGVEVLNWLHASVVESVPTLLDRVRNLRVVAPDSEPTDADIEQLRAYCNTSVGGPSERPTWYQLLRETQGNAEAILRAGVMEDGSGYGGIEWEYVVDCDLKSFRATDLDEVVAEWAFGELPADEEFIKALEGADE